MSDNASNMHHRRTFGNVARRVVRIKRQSRYGRPIQAVWKVFSEYSETSTVHGVRYLGERRRHWSERIWWILTVSVSVFLCVGFIFQAWWKWTTSPVIITFADEATPISNIPFPTLTICNDLMVNTTALNYTDIWLKLSQKNFTNIHLDVETVQKVNALSNFCHSPPTFISEYIEYKNISIDRNIMPYLETVSPNLTKSFYRGWCSLATINRIPCELVLKQILTDAGLCYTFNQMSSADIYNIETLADDFPTIDGFQLSHRHLTNFTKNGTEELLNLTYPYRMTNSGNGLELRMSLPKSHNHSDLRCSNILDGIKIQIHSGDEIPRLKKHFLHIPFDHDVRIFIRPNLMFTSPSLIENYNQKQRKCIAQYEHNLHFFKKYNQRNCHLDILALKMAKKCDCVLFWMPRHNNTKVCRSFKQFNCIEHVKNFIDSTNLTSQCLPVCDSITFDAEISISRIEVNALREFVPEGQRIIKVAVLFKDQQYFASQRSELYGTMDFIAQCGGILSLFMGISILSFVEIIYYATLRLSCRLRKQKLAKRRLLAQQNMIECLSQ